MKEKNSVRGQHSDLRESVQKAYSGSGDEYDFVRGDEAGTLLSEYDISIVKSMVPFVSGEEANNLEVGCGTGRFTIPLLKLGCGISATDINESLLKALREKLSADKSLERNCIVKVEDGFSLSYANHQIDGLLSIHVIGRFKTASDQLALLKEFSRVLRPGGRILFNFSNKSSFLYGKLYKKHLIHYDEVISGLSKLGFNIIELRGMWLVNGRLLRAVPSFLRGPIIGLDKMMQKFWTSKSWDVFVFAEKK